MKNTFQQVYGPVFILLLVVSIVSCSFFEQEPHHNPTAPGNSEQLTNFFAGRGTSSQFEVYPGDGFFKVNIPAAGDYHLIYRTNAGTFDLVFRSTNNALLTISLMPGDQLIDTSLQQGVIAANAIAGPQSGSVTLFAWPGSPVAWNTVFFLPGVSLPIPSTPIPTGGMNVIAAIGDSITFGEGSTLGGYPPLLEAKLRADGFNAVVRNQGIPGEQTLGTLARFQTAIDGANIVLVMIGTNDINSGVCFDPWVCQSISNIQTMLRLALEAGKIPFVSTVTPARFGGSFAWTNPIIQTFNSRIYQIAAELNVEVVDNYDAIIRHGGNALYSGDLHFNDAGYDIISWQWHWAILH